MVSCVALFEEGGGARMELVEKRLTEFGKFFKFQWTAIGSCNVKSYTITDTETRITMTRQAQPASLMRNDTLSFCLSLDDSWGEP